MDYSIKSYDEFIFKDYDDIPIELGIYLFN